MSNKEETMKSFKIKSFISIAVAAMLITAQGTISCLAAENPLHSMPQKTVQANVAQYKPVTAQLAEFIPGYEGKYINDGNVNNASVMDIKQNGYIQIDMLRRYNLKKIEVEQRVQQDHAVFREYIKLLGSDSEDFTQADVLGEIEAASDVYTHEKMWEINLDGTEDYRYLRLVRTGGDCHGAVGELRAYAEFDVTEVSRNKTATGNYWYETCNYDWAAPQEVLDGSEGFMNAWINYFTEGYNWLQVDLGEAYHIGYIEMTSRPEDEGALNTHQAFDFYGSNHAIDTDEEKNYVLKPEISDQLTHLEEEKGYTLLTQTLTADQYKNGFDSPDFPMSVTKPFTESVDDTDAFRYITYRHSWRLGSLIGMIGLYSVNPQVNKAEFSGNTVALSFSDKMNFENIENLITVKDSAGESVSVSNVSGADYELTFDVAVDNGEQYTVTLSKNLANTYDVPLQKNFEYSFKTPPAIEVTDFYFTAAKDGSGAETPTLSGLTELGVKAVVKNNTQNKTETAVIAIMLYDENGFLAAAETEKADNIQPGDEIPLKTGIDLPSEFSGYSAKALLWKDFASMNSWTPMININ